MFTPPGRRLTHNKSLRSKRRRCAVMTMLRVTEGLSAKGTQGTRSAYIRIRANGRCRGGTERQALCRGLALRQCADLPLP